MIKIVFRIIVILLVIALVTAGLYFLVQNNSSNIGLSSERQFNPQQTQDGSRPAARGNFRGGDHEFENGASLGRGLGGMLVTLFQIAIITLIVVQLQKILGRSRRLARS